MQRRRHGCPRVLPARLGAMPIGQISENGRNLPCSVREALGKLAPRDRSRTQSRIPQRVRGGLPASTVTRGAKCTSRSWYRTKTSTSIRQHDEVFAAHSAWITGLREHSTRLWGAAVPSPAALVAWGSRRSTSTSTSASTRPLTSSTTLSTARLAPISHGSRRTTSSISTRTSPSTARWAGLGRLRAALQLTTWMWTCG